MKKLVHTLAIFGISATSVAIVPFSDKLDKDRLDKDQFDKQVNFLCEIQKIRNKYQDLIDSIDSSVCMTKSQRSLYYEKAVQEGNAGMKCLDLAESITWYIPNADAQEVLKAAVKAAISSIGSGGAYKACMMTLINLAAEFAPLIIDQYNELNKYLREAEYHFEMSEFYLETAKKG